ncbi:glycosyltransferase [Lactobacillus sp. ESL0681]|uniref:glycosyltransferase n=1 Tax=Lactobacillus sp. ESL0681 TaxID=2983211 RepID=UPI0023F86735|nr:glycosyltransferase [Lactobacillus sp. ESL0681]WEV40172.1 glycosyltransferase [Lactobacillus sp. ESL0681]
MRVLHVNAGLESGGGLTHIINLLRQAQKQDQDFTLLCLAEGPVAQAARQAKLNVQVLGINSRYALTSLRQLVNFINEGNYDIVHTHGARANLFLSLIKRRISAVWCVTVHSDPYLDFAGRGILGKLFTKVNLHTLKKADCIFAVTQNFAQLLIKKAQLPAAKIHVIYNGIFFHNDDEIPAKYDHEHFNIVNVARAEKVKGQELLLKALKQLDNANVHLYIAGDGSQLASLKELTQKLSLGPQVTFQGFMTQKQLKNLYRRMNLAVLTSYSESFPLVLLEASDNLLPLLSTNVGDIEMMIPDQKHGFVAQIGDVASITAALKAAIATPPKQLVQIAQTEKKYVASNFSLEKQLTAIMQVYQTLIERDS